MPLKVKRDLTQCDKQELLALLNDIQSELKSKKLSLREVRSRLVHARKKIKTLQDTVHFQRKRIVDLYGNQNDKAAVL